MKKAIFVFTAAALVFGLNLKGITNASTPPAAHTGAPGENTCRSCHSTNPLNSGPGSALVTAPVAAYVPGATYTLQVNVTDATKQRFGFEMVALTGGNAQAGTFTIATPTNTATQASGGKTYVSHRNASTNNNWSFTWQAPATNVGPITFYLAGNAANNNSTDTGDNIYTSSLILTPSTTTGIQEDVAAQRLFYPNPVQDKLFLNLPSSVQKIRLFDSAGKEVLSTNQPVPLKQLDVSGFPAGLYFLRLEKENEVSTTRVVVQK